MNQISLHISYLLLTCRKVGVPGLGTFRAFCERAFFDEKDGVFYPIRIRILFSEKSNEKSSLLQKSLERQLNLKREEAEEMIREFVEKVGYKIKRQRYCRLEGIGYLMETCNHNLSLKDTFWKRYKHSTLSAVSV